MFNYDTINRDKFKRYGKIEEIINRYFISFKSETLQSMISEILRAALKRNLVSKNFLRREKESSKYIL